MECFGSLGTDSENRSGKTNHKDNVQDQDASWSNDNILRKLRQYFQNNTVKDDDEHIIEIQQKALDDIVSVNSLFTIAVFVGLAFASPGQRSLENRPECDADSGVAQRLIIYEVISFACFLLSSLTAKTLKVQLHIHKFKIKISFMKYKAFRGFMLSLSFLASLMGIIFLTLSMVNLIQIRLGKLSCGSLHSLQAVASLCGIVFVALAIYLPSSLNVIWVLITTPESRAQVESIRPRKAVG